MSAERKLNIFCHVERLGPNYDNSGEEKFRYFSLNLTAALTDAVTSPDLAAAIEKYLRIWVWRWEKIAVRGVKFDLEKNKDISEKIDDSDVEPISLELSNDQKLALEKIHESLGREFDRTLGMNADNSEKRFKPFLWQISKPLEETEISETERDWRGFLAHVSTFPAPIPYFLKLTALFRVKEAAIKDKYKEIIAAPIFDGSPFAASRKPKEPVSPELDSNQAANSLRRVNLMNPGAPVSSRPYFYEWEYEDAAGEPKLSAFQKECSVQIEEKPADSFLDLQTQWVTKPNNASVFLETDWTAQLEIRLADAFDLPARLLDALRENVRQIEAKLDAQNPNADAIRFWEVTQDFDDAFFASLRDLAGYGLRKASDGESVAEYLVRRLSPDKVEKITRLLALKDAALTLENWRLVLERFVRDYENKLNETQILPKLPQNNGDLKKYKNDLVEYLRQLERLREPLVNETPLALFFVEQWDQVFENLPDTDAEAVELKNFWRENKGKFTALLPNLQLRKRLALGNSEIGWRGLNANLHLKEKLQESLVAALDDYFDNRFGDAQPTSDYRSYFPRTATKPADSIAAAIRAGIKKFAEDFVRHRILAEPADADEPIDDNAPEGLTIQVDKIERAAVTAGEQDQEDYLRRIAGVGLLLRKHTADPAQAREWRCLNLANVVVKNGAKHHLWSAANVPLRLQYRNELRQCSFFYNNQPLAADSPAAKLSQKNEMIPPEELEIPSILDYENPYSSAAGAPKLEGLTYGQQYELAAFIIGNGGSLPAEIAAAGNAGKKIPWRLNASLRSSLENSFIKPFLRHKKIGALRIGSHSERKQKHETIKLDVPPIPEGVRPLARSLGLNEKTPLILLVKENRDEWKPEVNRSSTSFAFSVRPPSVPIDVWHYWVAETKNAAERAYIWGKFHELNDVETAEDKKNLPDATIDEPAVSGFEIKMTREYPPPQSGQSPAQIAKNYSFPPPPQFPSGNPSSASAADGLKYVQSTGLKFKIAVGKETALPDAPSNGIFQITIAEGAVNKGEIWLMELSPMVAEADKRRFKNFKTEPLGFYIEVAKPFVINDDGNRELHEALRPEFSPENNRLSVRLNEPKNSRDFIHKVDILAQRWRWDGRPVCYFDASLRPDDFKNLLALIKLLRDAASPLTANLKTRLSAENQDWINQYVAGNPISVESRDKLIGDLNNIINGVNLYQRELFNHVALRQETSDLLRDTNRSTTKLNRMLLEDAFPGELRIRGDLILGFPFEKVVNGRLNEIYDGTLFASRPADDYLLTSSQIDFVAQANERQQNKELKNPPLFERDLVDSPGALYYRFAARAYSRYAGLARENSALDSRLTASRNDAERWQRTVVPCRWNKTVPVPVVKFVCPLTKTHSSGEITPGFLVVLDEPWYLDSLGGLAEKFEVEIARVALPEDAREQRYQFGADPILDLSEDPLSEKKITVPPPVGAVGYTFDTDTFAPLFNQASFIVPAPRIDDRVSNLWWYFLKMRFRRSLDPGAVASQFNAPQPSDWTQAAWIQLLPPSNLFSVKINNEISIKDISEIGFDNIKAEFVVLDNRTPLDPLPLATTGEKGKFSLFALLTRRVTDAFGGQDQEVFVRLLPVERIKDLSPSERKGDIVIRLIEIQWRGQIEEDQNNVFRALFPTPSGSPETEAQDASARIVRVSSTIRGV